MPDVPPTVVKLGGSILTRKADESALRKKLLGQLARDMARVSDGRPLVVLHGAGSFGHPGAVRWKLAEPPDQDAASDSHRRRGASIVQAEVRRLHSAVLKAFLDAGLAPWSIPPGSLARNHQGSLTNFELGPFRDALSRGSLPVSFGDVVPDDSWGFSILSADTIAVRLVSALGVKRVIFVSDVPGILEPAARGRSRVVPVATPELLDRLAPQAGGPDVTGGIRGKLRAMLAIHELGADAGLISGLSDGALSRAVRGENVYGTWTQSTSG